MAKNFRAIYCLYMPYEVCFWGSLLPDCYIVTNISVLCLGKTKLSVCTGVCPLCAREHGDTNLGYRSGTLQCRYDYTQISTMPTEDTKQYSLRFTHPSLMPPPPHLLLTEMVSSWLCSSPAER